LDLERIASFASSASGQVYSTVCQRFAIDPAADVEDPFLAFQLRAALVAGETSEKPEGEELADLHRERVQASRDASAKLRSGQWGG
jgi:hypothetical protein